MIPFFRKIRKKLADDNRLFKYSRYAVGEIVLVVFGILIALYINNWNEQRKLNAQFKVTLELLYNSINYDKYVFNNTVNLLDWQIRNIDNMLLNADSFPKESLPWSIYVLSFKPAESVSEETIYHASFLKNSISNKKHNELSQQIVNYTNHRMNNEINSLDLIQPLFLEEEIPFPNPTQSLETNFYQFADTISFYSENELSRLNEIFHSHRFKATLKSIRSNKILQRALPRNREEDASSIMKLIKEYHPNVRIMYKNVGIIGTSIDGFPDVGAKSTPMVSSDEDHNIWKIEIYLKKGKVKFRCRDSWAQNWGGNSFPKGSAEHDGDDILVDEAGNYRVTLNLDQNTYQFDKIE